MDKAQQNLTFCTLNFARTKKMINIKEKKSWHEIYILEPKRLKQNFII